MPSCDFWMVSCHVLVGTSWMFTPRRCDTKPIRSATIPLRSPFSLIFFKRLPIRDRHTLWWCPFVQGRLCASLKSMFEAKRLTYKHSTHKKVLIKPPCTQYLESYVEMSYQNAYGFAWWNYWVHCHSWFHTHRHGPKTSHGLGHMIWDFHTITSKKRISFLLSSYTTDSFMIRFKALS